MTTETIVTFKSPAHAELWAHQVCNEGTKVANTNYQYVHSTQSVATVAEVLTHYTQLFSTQAETLSYYTRWLQILRKALKITTRSLLEELRSSPSTYYGLAASRHASAMAWLRANHRLPKGTDLELAWRRVSIELARVPDPAWHWTLDNLELVHTGDPKLIAKAYRAYNSGRDYLQWVQSNYSPRGDTSTCAQASPQSSCLRGSFAHLDYHPTEVFGGRLQDRNRVTLAYLRHKVTGETYARTLLFRGEYVRYYTAGTCWVEQQILLNVFREALRTTLNVTSRLTCWVGARLCLLVTPYVNEGSPLKVIAPYLDQSNIQLFVWGRINQSGYIVLVNSDRGRCVSLSDVTGYRNFDTSYRNWDISPETAQTLIGNHTRRCARLKNQTKVYPIILQESTNQ